MNLECLHAHCIRARMQRHFAAAMESTDVLVTPSTATAAPLLHPGSNASGELDAATQLALMRYTQLSNLLGVPLISVPVGLDDAGLPVGCGSCMT